MLDILALNLLLHGFSKSFLKLKANILVVQEILLYMLKCLKPDFTELVIRHRGKLGSRMLQEPQNDKYAVIRYDKNYRRGSSHEI
jgi:hypothetical protein